MAWKVPPPSTCLSLTSLAESPDCSSDGLQQQAALVQRRLHDKVLSKRLTALADLPDSPSSNLPGKCQTRLIHEVSQHSALKIFSSSALRRWEAGGWPRLLPR